jgi:hypothetical protein
VECKKSTQNILLNAAELEISRLSIRVRLYNCIPSSWPFPDSLPSKIQVVDVAAGIDLNVAPLIDEQSTREIITIPVAPPSLQTGKQYKIIMKFVSKLNDQLRGLYRSRYEENGQTK